MCVFRLTVCGFLQWKYLGKAIGVDIERATGQVFESDLETQFKPMEDQQTVIQRACAFSSAR